MSVVSTVRWEDAVFVGHKEGHYYFLFLSCDVQHAWMYSFGTLRSHIAVQIRRLYVCALAGNFTWYIGFVENSGDFWKAFVVGCISCIQSVYTMYIVLFVNPAAFPAR